MRLDEFLTQLPLTSYERAIVSYLCAARSAGASAIVRHAGVPQGRVYDVLRSLGEKGLVACSSLKPKQYRIDDPKASITAYLAQERQRFERRIADLSHVGFPSRTELPRPNPASVVVLQGRDAHLRAITGLRDAAKRELLQIAPLFVGSSASNRSLSVALERGVKARIIVADVSARNRPAIAAALAGGAFVRRCADGDLLSLLICDREVGIVGAQEYRANEERINIQTRNHALVAELTRAFERMWRESAPIGKPR